MAEKGRLRIWLLCPRECPHRGLPDVFAEMLLGPDPFEAPTVCHAHPETWREEGVPAACPIREGITPPSWRRAAIRLPSEGGRS